MYDFFTQQIFIRSQNLGHIYSETNSIETNDSSQKKRNIQNELTDVNNFTKTFKVVHKDQDAINSFCLNEVIFENFHPKIDSLFIFRETKIL